METEAQTSRFNEATFQIERLHNLWLAIGRNSRHGRSNLTAWKFLLDEVWRELIADVEKMADTEGIKKENEKLKKNIVNARGQEDLYNALDERHCFLKIIQDKSGKGGSYQDENAFDID